MSKGHFIHGNWIAAGGAEFFSRDPATGDVILSPRPESWKPFFDSADKADVPDDFLSDRGDAPPQKRGHF